MTVLDTPIGTYRWHENWITIPEAGRADGRTHGVGVLRDGTILIFHRANPGMLAYDPDGRLLRSWGDYPGAHSLTLVEENGAEFLWLTDEVKCTVEKTTPDGTVLQRLEPPPEPADREENYRYIPTWAAVNEIGRGGGGNGDIWVADGYGGARVHRYDAGGRYLSTLDGTEGAGRYKCPHGLAFDFRKNPAELYVADRGNRRVQVYDGEGRFKRVFGSDFFISPNGFTFCGDRVIVPELRARVTIIDADDRLVAHLGANEPIRDVPGWPDSTPVEPGKFNSPHAAAVDAAGNIYVVEWRIGGRVTKLEKIS